MMMLLMMCILMSSGRLFAGTKHNLKQWVTNVPFGREKGGYHFFIYNIQSATTNVLDEHSEGSDFVWTGTGKLKWKMNLAHFPEQWSAGDTILCFGSWDSAYASDSLTYGDNFNHTGFYWLFSDTIDDKANQTYNPDDTLWPLPPLIVSQTGPGDGGNDTIWIKIPNPDQTRRVDQSTYDVLGFWLFADSTGVGSPNAYNSSKVIDIGFIPVQGGIGDTTVYWQYESEFFTPWHNWTTFFAYKLVVAPCTTVTENPDSPGYSTYYFSQNSDTVDVYQIVVGIEEHHVKLTQMHTVFPNPFWRRTDITFSISEQQRVTIQLYNALGQTVRTVFNEMLSAGTHVVTFDGTDDHGSALPAGVYFYEIQAAEIVSGRFIKAR